MTHDDLMDLGRTLTDGVLDTLDKKGLDYAPWDDALHEFRTSGAALGLSSEQVWAVHFQKQVKAILRYCKEGNLESEPIGSRITDVIAYAILLSAITNERTTS